MAGALTPGDSTFEGQFKYPFDAAKYGLRLRDSGDEAGAEALFRWLTTSYPEAVYGWQELGFLYSRSGRNDEATNMFRQAIKVEPRDFQPRMHLAMHLTGLDRHDDAAAVIADYNQSSVVDARKVKVFREFLVYLRAWPKMDALESANGLERNGFFSMCADVEAQIFRAIYQKAAFSVVRLGDGEGSWFKLSLEDELTYPNLYNRNRRDFLRIWFNDETLYQNQSFHDVAASMLEDFRLADIVGIPYSLRVNHEYHVASTRGVPSVRNILRWLDSIPRHANQRFCSQDIHIELQRSGFFRRLFATSCQFGVISCHEGLPALIEARTQGRISFVHLVPEEKGMSGILGSNGVRLSHFPVVYNDIVAKLRSESQQGRVWIVAAGILGKRYCAEIRARGGVALDVGSIVDAWLGKATRPTFDMIDEFAL